MQAMFKNKEFQDGKDNSLSKCGALVSAQVTCPLKTAQPLEPSVGWATMEIRDGILFFILFFFF